MLLKVSIARILLRFCTHWSRGPSHTICHPLPTHVNIVSSVPTSAVAPPPPRSDQMNNKQNDRILELYRLYFYILAEPVLATRSGIPFLHSSKAVSILLSSPLHPHFLLSSLVASYGGWRSQMLYSSCLSHLIKK